MSSSPLPPRPPADVAAAQVRLGTVGGCCGHPFAVHAGDGCRGCQALGRADDCSGWSAASPNTHMLGIEDSDALACLTPGCGHRADRHQEQPVQVTGPGACLEDGCDCWAWFYTTDAGEDVVDAEVLDPVGDAIRAALDAPATPYVDPDRLDAATAAVVSALEQHADDVADYLRLPRSSGGTLDGDRLHAIAAAIAVATDRYNGEGTAVLAALSRAGWRLERTAPGMQVG